MPPAGNVDGVTDKRVYRGQCHCGAVRFQFTTEAIGRGLRCNCSICSRRGVVMSVRYFGSDEMKVEGRDALTLYRWGHELVSHWFCRVCGVYVFHDPVDDPGRFRVNLGCVGEIDPLLLEIDHVDGRAF
jgi:hypothetical protein